MCKKTGKRIIFCLITLIFILRAGSALALELHYPDIFGYSLNDTSTLANYTCYLYALITALAFFITVACMAFGGVYFLVSYGQGKFTSEAKEWIRAGVLGLLIVVCAALIINTINPNLAACKLAFLPSINLGLSGGSNPFPGKPTVNYKEIPIGTLTETMLTRKIDCYGFDQDGNPITGDKIITDEPDNKTIDGPTYMNHDRADCLLQLIDGAQKKSQAIAGLSDQITYLMDTKCTCKGKCIDSCDAGGKGCDPLPDNQPLLNGAAYAAILKQQSKGQQTTMCNGQCTGINHYGAYCIPQRQPGGSPDCCDQDANVNDPKTGKPLNISVKTQIENGPVNVATKINTDGSNCQTPTKTYRGLDEFRSQFPEGYDAIKKAVEKTVSINNQLVQIIDTGNCGACNAKSPADCQDKLEKCKADSPWFKLRLVDQLTYLKGKIDELTEGIKKDEKVLSLAKTMLANCYPATSYVDLLKLKETTNTKDLVIKTEAFVDPETNNKIDISKYCQGFNYNNSSCLKKCNDICPDTGTEVVGIYKECGTCQGYDVACLNAQETCIKNAYTSRPCTLGNNPSQVFWTDAYGKVNDKSCISSCQSDCVSSCKTKYMTCSNEYAACQDQCNNNSQCVLNNAGACLFSSENFQQCANQVSDQGNTDYCINNAYLCKNGSDEYAGYSDCAEPSSIKCSSFTSQDDCQKSIECLWDGQNCSQNYSSSFFYNNPSYQKCPTPGEPPKTGSICYSSALAKNESNTSCQQLCPETTKCPASSNCPKCPCDQINQTLKFSVPNISVSEVGNPNYNVGKEDYFPSQQPISANEVVGAQCTGYSYNDDPLTFYCEDNWQSPTSISRELFGTNPIGKNYSVDLSQQGEIPVGQAVDGAENWADTLIANANKIKQNIQKIIDDMVKAGDALKKNPVAKDYCKCNALYDVTKLPVCKSTCDYSQSENPPIVQCTFDSCHGNSCQQMIDWLSNIWNDYREIKLGFIDFYTIMAAEPRSDIMKKLAYSRKAINTCSSIINADKPTLLLSCSVAGDEVVSPINEGKTIINNKTFPDYCYGVYLGNHLTPAESLTDDWFCATKYSKTPILKK